MNSQDFFIPRGFGGLLPTLPSSPRALGWIFPAFPVERFLWVGNSRQRGTGIPQECPDSSKTAFSPQFGQEEIAIPTGFCSCRRSSTENERKKKVKKSSQSGFGLLVAFSLQFSEFSGGVEGLTRGQLGNWVYPIYKLYLSNNPLEMAKTFPLPPFPLGVRG